MVSLEEAAHIIAHSKLLCRQGHTLLFEWRARRSARSREAAHERGEALIAPLLAERGALCARCIARKTGVELDALHDILVGLGETVSLATTIVSCDGCQRQTVVHRLGSDRIDSPE
jgi:hypothetical protein